MSKGKETRYINLLTKVDRVVVRSEIYKGVVVSFSVQYEALIKSRWRKIMRYDNSHNDSIGPHRHVYYPNGLDLRTIMHTKDSNEAFTEAQFSIKRYFQQYRESYIILLEKGGGAKK